jgi:hypothetical protein
MSGRVLPRAIGRQVEIRKYNLRPRTAYSLIPYNPVNPVFFFRSLFLKSTEPGIRESVAGAIGRPLRWIHLTMRPDDGVMRIDFPAAFPQIIDQLFARLQLTPRRLTAIEIAYQTNAERDVVQIDAVHMPAIDLAPPAIARFDLAVARGSAITDDEMIGEPVLHPANMTVVIIENAGIALPSATVVHDNELPAAPHNRRPIDFISHRPRKVQVSNFRPRPEPPTTTRRRARRRFVTLITEKSRLLDLDLRNGAG